MGAYRSVDSPARSGAALRSCLAVLTLGLAILVASTAATHAARLALVIGIDAYSHVPQLQKAVNDARSVAAAVSRAGFETVLLTDVDQLDLVQGVTNFAGRLRPGDEALFFFAGHGVEISGQNYLLPADVPGVSVGQELVLTSRALEVGTLVEQVQMRGARVTMLILDACRDNPFQRRDGRGIGAARGLAKVDAPEGSFILFSAGTGQAALDRLSDGDPEPNSVFTRSLLPYFAQPGLEVQELSRRVRSDVRKLALTVQHEQFPAIYDQLDGGFVLVPGGVTVSSAPDPSPPLRSHDPCDAAREDWPLVSDGKSPTALKVFAENHADCPVLAAMANDLRSRTADTARPAPQPAPPFEYQARALVARIVSEWSLPNSAILPRLPHYFADEVLYYGQRRTRAQVIAEKTAVAARWPIRDYRIEPGSLSSICGAQECRISAVIVWDARAPDRNASASGRSSCDVTVRLLGGSPVVVEESGRTLRRD